MKYACYLLLVLLGTGEPALSQGVNLKESEHLKIQTIGDWEYAKIVQLNGNTECMLAITQKNLKFFFKYYGERYPLQMFVRKNSWRIPSNVTVWADLIIDNNSPIPLDFSTRTSGNEKSDSLYADLDRSKLDYLIKIFQNASKFNIKFYEGTEPVWVLNPIGLELYTKHFRKCVESIAPEKYATQPFRN